MPVIRDVSLQFEDRDSRLEPIRKFEPAILQEINGSVAVPGRPDYVWAQEYAQPQSIFQILNRRVAPLAGLTVKVGYPEKPPFLRQVIGVWDDIADLDGYEPNAGLDMEPHAQSHQYPSESNPGTDPVLIYQPALQLLKTFPQGSGLEVVVWPLDAYTNEGVYGSFAGQILDLTSSIPGANMVRFVLTYLDTTTGLAMVAEGAEVVDSTPDDLIPKPELPEKGISSAFIRLEDGQTTISEIDDLIDARYFLGLHDAVKGYPFNVITVDLVDPDADYDNIDDAISAASSNDVIHVGPGTYSATSALLPTGVKVLGHGIGITVISYTEEDGLRLDDNCSLSLLTVENSNPLGAVTGISIEGDGCRLTDIRSDVTNDSESGPAGAAHAYDIAGQDVILQDCEGIAPTANSQAIAITTSKGTAFTSPIIVINGYYEANSAILKTSGEDPFIILNSPRLYGEIDEDDVTGYYLKEVSLNDPDDGARFALHNPYISSHVDKITMYPDHEPDLSHSGSLVIYEGEFNHQAVGWFTLEVDQNTLGFGTVTGEAILFDILLIGKANQASYGSQLILAYRIDGLVNNNAGVGALIYSTVTTLYEDEVAFEARVAVSGPFLQIEVRDTIGSITDKIVAWTATVRTSQVIEPQ